MGVKIMEILPPKNNPILVCTSCKRGIMEPYFTFDGRGPPIHIVRLAQKPKTSVVV